MGHLARVLRSSGPTHGSPPCSFSLSLGDVVPTLPDLIKVVLKKIKKIIIDKTSQELVHDTS
jgi:hypothetical protein